MTLLYFDNDFLKHDTGNHCENRTRLTAIIERLESLGLLEQCERPSWKALSRQQVQTVHTPQHVEHIASVCNAGGGSLDADTIVSDQSFDVACLAAGAVVDAVERVVRGEQRTALCLVRPPGHHALADSAMGFCLFNNVALGARFAVDQLGLSRVLIVDWDVHHGNGTQAIFWRDYNVAFFSLHRFPFYPGTGLANDVGEGEGTGTIFNLPIQFGTPADMQLQMFEEKLNEFAAEIQPQLILISAGFDSHRDDPIGSLGWDSADFSKATALVTEVARVYASGRVVSVLEGGYNTQALAESVGLHLASLLEFEAEIR
ncbi:MAG TPA: histone deacetylase [Pirellulaceae bacterium]|nr:histone deacetylase [Pirellulaceae bacterium]